MIEKQLCEEKNCLEAILMKSIHTLVYEKDINVALSCFLETIGKYYQAERAYIFEFDLEKTSTDNTFEWCGEGIESHMDNLKGISIDLIPNWMEKFREDGKFYIAAVDKETPYDRADVVILKQQGIQSLMAAPLVRDEEIVGFIGVDNPAQYVGDMTLLCSVADFVISDLEKRRLIEELSKMSCIDMLTSLKNRNEYMRKFYELKITKPQALGVIFIDINGLKQMNDTHGHEYGDKVIRQTAAFIKKHAGQNAYRIGGDEFVILWDNMEEEVFQEKTAALKAEFTDDGEYSIAMGSVWQGEDADVEKQVKKADAYMYEAKQMHYQNRNFDRRKRR